MQLRVGETLESVVDGTALVVVRGSGGESTVTCGGRPMVPRGEADVRVAAASTGPGLLLGKRYTVEGLELELLCIKAGEHPVRVDGAELVVKAAKPLPASD